MKFIFLILISFLIKNILTKENTSSTKAKYIKKIVKPNGPIKIDNVNEEEGFFSSEKIHELNDITFDYIIRDGQIYRWFILFYSRSCGHCKRAKKEILKIFDTYKNKTNLRFAEIEAYQNTMTNIRFNVTGVPYMIIVENKSMYEMDLFPNYDNLKDFIFTNFTEVKDDLKPFPRKVKFAYVAWLILKQTLDDFTSSFNRFLTNRGIKFQFNTWGFVVTIIAIIILICWGIIQMCLKCCCNDDDIALELQKLEEEYNKRRNINAENKDAKENEEEEGEGEGEEYEIEEEEEDDEGEEVEKKEMTEEEKKRKIEEEKEKEKEVKDEIKKKESELKEENEENEISKGEKEKDKDKNSKNKKKKKE